MNYELLSLLPIGFTAALTIPLAITDIREHRLPNKFTYLLFVISLLSLTAASLFLNSWGNFLVVAIAGSLTFAAGALLAKVGAIGMGDIKLLTSLHMILGWHQPWLPVISLAIGLAAATVLGFIGIVLGRVSAKSLIPLGPFLLVGFLVVSYVPVAEVTAGAWS